MSSVWHIQYRIALLKIPAVIVFWDYVVTFDREVTMFWGRRFNGAALLFYLTRYGFLAYTLWFIIPAGSTEAVSVYSSFRSEMSWLTSDSRGERLE